MKTIKVQLYLNRITQDISDYLTYTYQYNLKHGILLNFDMKNTDVRGYKSVSTAIAAGGSGYILQGADALLPPSQDEIVMFMFDMNEWKAPWYWPYPLSVDAPRSSCGLSNGKPFINLAFYPADSAWTKVTMCHELLHAYTKIANMQGIPVVDQMDTYDHNNEPDFPGGNFDIQWKNLQRWLNPSVGCTQSTIDLICGFEGFSPKPYQDLVGKWTIGYGFTSYAGIPVTSKTKAITVAEAQKELNAQLKHYVEAVSSVTRGTLNQNQFDACVSLCYNIGIGGFSSSTVAKQIAGKNMQAAADAFLLWNKAGGKVIKGLTNRRIKERALFLS